MWFMKKIVNPLVALILRSPLHRMMSGAVLLITYSGRKSGREYTLPVQYAQVDGTITIVPGQAERKTWWRNLRGGAPVRLLLAGEARSGQATVLEGSAEAVCIANSLAVYFKRFPSSAGMRGIRTAEDGSFDAEALRQAAAATVVVQVKLEP
jgi:hypothetical protein